MWKFIRELACDYLESRQPDAVSKKAPSTAPIVDLNDSSKPSSRMTLDYSRFDRIVADLDQEERLLRNKKNSSIPPEVGDREHTRDCLSNKSQGACSHDHSHERRVFEKSNDEKLKAIRMFRQEGNENFKSKSYDEALICYKRALLYLDYSIGETDSEEDKFESERLKCHLNLAAVYLERKSYDETINQCRLALQIESECVKALYRRGVAYLGKDELEQAQADLYAALKRGSSEGRDTINAIEGAIRELNVKWREYRRRSRAVAQSAFRS